MCIQLQGLQGRPVERVLQLTYPAYALLTNICLSDSIQTWILCIIWDEHVSWQLNRECMPERLEYRVCYVSSRNMISRRHGSYQVGMLIGPWDDETRCWLEHGYIMMFLAKGHSLETFPQQMIAVRDAGHEMYAYIFMKVDKVKN